MMRVAGVLVSVILALSSCAAIAQPPVANVRVDEVRLESVEQMRRVTGELRARRRSRLATQEEGLVLELAVREGEAVASGQIIAELDGRNLELELNRLRALQSALEAGLVERQAELDLAETELERVRSLREAASASQQELDDAVLESAVASARLQRAEADIAASQAAIAQADKRLADMTIRAPFAGRVVARMTEVGQWLDQGAAVVELYESASIEAWIDVPERYVGTIASMNGEGSAKPVVQVRIDAVGETRPGSIIQVVPAADPLSRLFPVRVLVPDEAGELRPGMSVVAEVPTGARVEAVTVHKDAILRDGGGEFVYTTVPNEMGEGLMGVPVRISREFAVGNRVAIRAGRLQPGMSVVVEGNERMVPTQPVIVQNGGQNDGEPGAETAGQPEGRS
ncbi:MAG: efflux RND transporter periplasmic adaptor subunit [Planctomycetota bacterium]